MRKTEPSKQVKVTAVYGTKSFTDCMGCVLKKRTKERKMTECKKTAPSYI
ncbi:hypothetical protein AALC25_14910 [Lachnospiraceae bacterium 29-84]